MKASNKDSEKTEFDLFEYIRVLDKKDYDYFASLPTTQQNTIVSLVMLHWMSTVVKNSDIEKYYVLATEELANKHFFNEYLNNHPQLKWLMLCTISPNMGTQRHEYLPKLPTKIINLLEHPDTGVWRKYLLKVYKNATKEDISEVAIELSEEYFKKYWLAKIYPNMKLIDINNLSKLITEDDVKNIAKEIMWAQ